MAASVTVTVDPSAELPPYQQIYEQICSAIQRGNLRSGATLPTVRQLAGDLNVAPNTVARAYSDLQDAGWLLSDGRRGTRVTEDVPTADKRVRKSVLRERVSAFIASMKARGYSRSEILSELNRTA